MATGQVRMNREKRTVPIKVLLSESEALELYRQSEAQDISAADVLRKGWLHNTFGSVGLARLRAKLSRGSDEFLEARDFADTSFGNNDGQG